MTLWADTISKLKAVYTVGYRKSTFLMKWLVLIMGATKIKKKNHYELIIKGLIFMIIIGIYVSIF